MDEPSNNNKDEFLLDIDDLIEAASSESETFSTEASSLDPYHIQVRDFIREQKLLAGATYVPSDVVYMKYSDWSPNPCTKHKFTSIMQTYYTTRRIMGYTCMKLDPESLGLPPYYTIYKDAAFNKKGRKFDSSYEGVYKASGYFISRIKLEDGTHYLGQFKTDRLAAMEYDRHALYHFGPTTKLNFPERLATYEQELKEKED